MLLRRLERAIPPTQNHPVFKRDVRAIHWWLSTEKLPDYSFRKLLQYMIGLLAAWLVAYAFNPHSAEALFSSVHGWLLSIIVTGIFVDLASLGMALQGVNSEVQRGYWDLLRLTPLTKDSIVTAKLATTRLRVWNIMLLSVSIRNFMALMLGLRFVLSPEASWLHRTMPSGSSLQLACAIGSLVLVSILYVLEPLWRMKAMTTVGVMISAHFYHRVFYSLLPPMLVSLIWLAQPFVVVGLLAGIVFMLMPLALIAYMVDISNTVFVFLLVICLIAVWTIRHSYEYLHYISLKRAVGRFDSVLEIE